MSEGSLQYVLTAFSRLEADCCSVVHDHQIGLACSPEHSSGDGGASSFLLPGVMGTVRERQPQQRAPRPPTGPAAGAAFPIAMHRSKSKASVI